MEEPTQYETQISLAAQLSALTSAANMHIRRAEELAAEIDQIRAEIEAAQGGAQE